MVAIYAPADVGAVVTVLHWPVMHGLVGLCITVSPVPMFYVSSDGGCVVPSKVIVLLTNDYNIFCILDKDNILQPEGVGGYRGWDGFVYWFKVEMRNVQLQFILLFMCCAHLVPQLSLLPGADMFSVGTHPTFLPPVYRVMQHVLSLANLLAWSFPMFFRPQLSVAVSVLWWG